MKPLTEIQAAAVEAEAEYLHPDDPERACYEAFAVAQRKGYVKRDECTCRDQGAAGLHDVLCGWFDPRRS